MGIWCEVCLGTREELTQSFGGRVRNILVLREEQLTLLAPQDAGGR